MGKKSRWTPITLLIDEGDGEEPRRVSFQQPVIKVGKMSSAHLPLDGEGVSRMHAYIQEDCGRIYISDLGSAHGTHVNGQRVNKARLEDGDVIKLGEVKITVELKDEKTGPNPHGESAFNFKKGPRNLDDIKRKLGLKNQEPHEVVSEIMHGVVKTAAGAVRDAWRHRYKILDDKENDGKPDSEKVYYCEKCLTVHGRLTEMVYVENDPDDDEGEMEGFWCRQCQSAWRVNRGQARHLVSLKLQHYRALAKKLGILEIEELDG